MLGAIVGDIVGSPYEFAMNWTKTTQFELFTDESQHTDDSLMTLAVGQALLDADGDEQVADELLVTSMQTFGRAYPLPKGGYGSLFGGWLTARTPAPYMSYGNGSAMRVSAAGWLFDTLEETEHWAEITARVTHNHPEGIKGAQATAAAIFLARTEGGSGIAGDRMREYITERFDYDLSRTTDEIRPGYVHVETCQETVPEAVTAFLESSSFEHAIRLAVSLGGDADTLTAITGSIAEAAYGVPKAIEAQARQRLSSDLVAILDRFNQRVQVRLATRMLAALEPSLAYIRSRPRTPWTPMSRVDNAVTLPHPIYDDRIAGLYAFMGAPGLADFNYRERATDVLGEDRRLTADIIRGLDIWTVRAVITGIVRTERFVDGSIAGALSGGTLADLVDRVAAIAGEAP